MRKLCLQFSLQKHRGFSSPCISQREQEGQTNSCTEATNAPSINSLHLCLSPLLGKMWYFPLINELKKLKQLVLGKHSSKCWWLKQDILAFEKLWQTLENIPATYPKHKQIWISSKKGSPCLACCGTISYRTLPSPTPAKVGFSYSFHPIKWPPFLKTVQFLLTWMLIFRTEHFTDLRYSIFMFGPRRNLNAEKKHAPNLHGGSVADQLIKIPLLLITKYLQAEEII